MDAEQVKRFLEELTELTKKYKIRIDGCGCCGSPFLLKVVNFTGTEQYVVGENFDNLQFTAEKIIL